MSEEDLLELTKVVFNSMVRLKLSGGESRNVKVRIYRRTQGHSLQYWVEVEGVDVLVAYAPDYRVKVLGTHKLWEINIASKSLMMYLQS